MKLTATYQPTTQNTLGIMLGYGTLLKHDL